MPDGQVANAFRQGPPSDLASFGFREFSQRGSHIKLRRTLPDGAYQTLTIVHHAEVDRGTLHAIYHQALRFIPEADLRPHFYSD